MSKRIRITRHVDKLIGERARWFSRPEAHAIRKAELERISK